MTKFCVYQIIIQVTSDIICHHFDVKMTLTIDNLGFFDKSKILLSNFTLIFAQLLNKCFNIWIKRFAYIKEILKNNPKFFCKFTIIKKLELDKKSSLQMVKNI